MHVRVRVNPAYLFLAPSAIALLVFTLWPIVQAFWMSLFRWSFLDPNKTFVGLGNYEKILADDRFWNALKNTALYTLGSVPTQIVLALLLAVALNQRLKGTTFLRAAYFFPVISSLAVMAIVWSFLIDPDIGLVTNWLAAIGLPKIAWLQDPGTALIAVTIVGIWKNVGFDMVIILAGLQAIPVVYYEAAALDGAGRWQRFRHVTLPGLRHALLFVTVITFIASLQVFDQVYVMTRGGPLHATETIVSYMYYEGFTLFKMGYAAALAWILFVLIMVASFLQLRFFRYNDVD